MDRRLIDIPIGELLNKFGAGLHKPGSGSASALSAMLSAKMVLTVIDLTSGKRTYAEYLPRLQVLKEVIEKEIYPELVELFEKDSVEFDKVIKLRIQRNEETDPAKRQSILDALERVTRVATQIPIRIAELSLDLGDFAVEVFDNGYRAVRGDSGVALDTAIAAISGCLYIADLNLASIRPGEWMEDIAWRKSFVKQKYRELQVKNAERHDVLEREAERHLSAEFDKAMTVFRKGNLSQGIRTDEDLERLVRNLQNQLWIHRERIWDEHVPEGLIQVLKPEIVLKKVLGYDYVEMDSLGLHEANGDLFEVAGMIDKEKKLVRASRAFSDESIRFTVAHELAHAILHEETVLHRDRSIDGLKNAPRVGNEEQADKFAALFLMPGRLVVQAFRQAFEAPRFELNEGSGLALRVGNYQLFRERCVDVRGLARYLAGAEYFGGKTFVPLAKFFGVSIETMAIRLEELRLVKY